MILRATIRAPRPLVLALSIAVLAASTGAAACDSAEPERRAPIDAETYTRVMSELADLERFPPPGPDSAARVANADAARREILDRYGVSADDLLEFAEIVGRQPARMVEIMDRIVEATDSLARRRTGGGRDDGAPDGRRSERPNRPDTSSAPSP